MNTQKCVSVTTCRDPNEPEPCYAGHECELVKGHDDAHYSSTPHEIWWS